MLDCRNARVHKHSEFNYLKSDELDLFMQPCLFDLRLEIFRCHFLGWNCGTLKRPAQFERCVFSHKWAPSLLPKRPCGNCQILSNLSRSVNTEKGTKSFDGSELSPEHPHFEIWDGLTQAYRGFCWEDRIEMNRKNAMIWIKCTTCEIGLSTLQAASCRHPTLYQSWCSVCICRASKGRM